MPDRAGPPDATTARARLTAVHADLIAQAAELQAQFDDVVAAADASNVDDEHDPEGATIAFERAQLSSLLDAIQRRLDEVDGALRRVESGEYGVCHICGGPVEPERLEARPAATACIHCA